MLSNDPSASGNPRQLAELCLHDAADATPEYLYRTSPVWVDRITREERVHAVPVTGAPSRRGHLTCSL